MTISTTTGSGTVDGNFAVVINLDNPTDAPEFVAMTGTFKGSMQVVVDTTAKPPRTLPLINSSDGASIATPTDVLGFPIAGRRPGSGLARLKHKLDPAPLHRRFRLTLHGGPARLASAGVTRTSDAFYLGDHGQLIRVQPDERSLGFPTVRVEIDF